MDFTKHEFELATTWLYSKFPSYQQIGDRAYKPSLENTFLLIDHFGIQLDQFRFIHVAGSNGKGTVCSILASILKEAGYKTGLFTSPHLFDYTERIRINGKTIPEREVIQFVKQLQSNKLPCTPSFFEMSFVMALYYFQEQKCNICVIETGLGGRLDSTNVIDPIVSVITTISLEHTKFLGTTLAAIAQEKGGIIKAGRPVIFGEIEQEPIKVLKEIATERKAKIYYSNPALIDSIESPFIPHSYQHENLITAITCTEVLNSLDFTIKKEHIQLGLNHLTLNSGYRGRMQILGKDPMCILDVAHNTEGIAALLNSISKLQYHKLHLIYGSSSDKDLTSIMDQFPKNADLYLTTFAHERAADVCQLRRALDLTKRSGALIFNNPAEALKEARQNAQKDDCILICGSFFLVSSIL